MSLENQNVRETREIYTSLQRCATTKIFNVCFIYVVPDH